MTVTGRLRRRVAFASPLVFAIACWRSTDPVDPAAAREPASRAGGAPSDARPEAAISADRPSVAAAPVDAAVPVDGAAPSPQSTQRTSSTASLLSRSRPGTAIARVIAVSVTADAMVVTIAAGTNRGVRQDWLCQLINNDDGPADTDDCTILRVDKAVTMARTKLTADQIRVYSRAVLAPPPP